MLLFALFSPENRCIEPLCASFQTKKALKSICKITSVTFLNRLLVCRNMRSGWAGCGVFRGYGLLSDAGRTRAALLKRRTEQNCSVRRFVTGNMFRLFRGGQQCRIGLLALVTYVDEVLFRDAQRTVVVVQFGDDILAAGVAGQVVDVAQLVEFLVDDT